MATYYKFDLALSLITYRLLGTGGVRTRPIAEIPELAQWFSSRIYDITQSSAPTSLNARAFQNVYVKSIAEPPLVTVHETLQAFPAVRTRNPHFAERVRAGEIILSEYSVGTGRLIERDFVDFRSLSGFTIYGGVGGWNVVALSHEIRQIVIRFEGQNVDSVNWAAQYSLCTLGTVPIDHAPSVKMLEHVPSVVDTAVVTSCLDKAHSAAYDVLTELAELPEMVAFLGGALNNILETATEFKAKTKRISRLPGFKQAAAIAQAELAFRYAVMPIVYSIEDIQKMLKVYGTVFHRSVDSTICELEPPEVTGGYFYSQEGASIFRCLIKQSFDPESVVHNLIRLIGPNPLVTLWELVPGSFIADWVFNIGDYISALTGIDISKQTASCVSTRTEMTWRYTSTNGLALTEYSVNTYHRYPINPYDHIGLVFSPYMDWVRWLDATSLTYLRLKGNFNFRT